MREGLRSGKLLLKSENGKVSVGQVISEERKLGDEDGCVVSDSGVEKVLNLVSCGPEPERESLVLQLEKKGCELENEGFEGGGGDEGEGERVGVVDSAGKRKREDGGGIDNDDGVARKKVKEEESNDDKVQVCRRVLRSGTAVAGECVKAEGEDALGGKSRDGDGSEKVMAVERKEKCDNLVGGVSTKLKRKRGRPPLLRNAQTDEGGSKNLTVTLGGPHKVAKEERDLLESDTGLRKKLKNKRGRPRKVPESTGVLKLKRGRPKKVPEGSGVLKRKRGRPRKVPESNGVLKRRLGRPPKVKEGNEALRLRLRRPCKVEKQEPKPLVSDDRSKKKLKGKRGRPPKVQESNEALKGDADKQGEASLKDKRILKLQEKNEADLETTGNQDSSGKTSKAVNALSLENKMAVIGKGPISKKGEAERARSVVKQSVREKIIEILLSAGWTIQRRPRNGREYWDSVFVNLDGRTHWSVTLAYNMLKQHYEEGSGDSKYYKTGFKFVPIPEDELGILKRVINKRREGKKKLYTMEGECGNSMDGAVRKNKLKKKLVGRSLKRRTKGKTLLHEQAKSASMWRKGMLVSNRDYNQETTQNGKRTLLVRKSMEEGDLEAGGYIPYPGKRTVLAWMIDLGTVSVDAKVHYMNQRKTRVLLEGRLTRDGIHCDCCNQILTISEFEIHAGSKLREPFINTCLASGTSLLQCLLDSWNKQPETELKGFHYIDVNGDDPNDDTCGICGDGGDLICCDSCPSTFHQNCLDIQKFPSGDWHCVYCSCKFCGITGGDECQNDNDNLAASELLMCQLCEEKYHRLCSKEKNAGHDYSSSLSFCGQKCLELLKKLKKLLGVKHDLEEGFSCTLLCRSDIGSSTYVCDNPQKDVAQKIECNSKLAVALSIMDECFLPMVDNRSGINLIRNIVYNFGSNFNRLNYSGFITAILERGDEIVSAASIRIHGYQLAEMPFIGTRYLYRRQGMCRRLLSAIESVLCSLGVERLVIPAVSELQETWSSVFGFRPIEVSGKEKMKNMNMMVFPGVQMLQKPPLKLQIADVMEVLVGPRSTEPEEHESKEMLCETDNTNIKNSVSNISNVTIEPRGDERNEPTVESSLQFLDGSLDSTEKKLLVQLGMAHDNLEGKSETIKNPLGSVGGFQEQTEEITECLNASSGTTTPVIDQTAIELSSQLNQHIVSEEENKSSVLPSIESGAPECGRLPLHASGEDTENADCEVKVDDRIVADNLNCFEGSICLSNEFCNSLPQKKTISHELVAAIERVDCSESEARSQMPNGDHSKYYLEEKALVYCEMPNDGAAVVQTSLTLGDIFLTSKCSKDSSDVVHPTPEQKPEDDSRVCQTLLPVDSSYSSSHENGLEKHDALISNPIDHRDPSCGAYLESNGHCKSKKVISGSLGVIVDSLQD